MGAQPDGTFTIAALAPTATFVTGADGRAGAIQVRQHGRDATLPRVR
jgi:hypothetical protein